MREDKVIEIKVAIESIEQAVNYIAYAEKKTDWEQRRYEIAKSAMQGMIAADRTLKPYGWLAQEAVEYADALIAELKKKE